MEAKLTNERPPFQGAARKPVQTQTEATPSHSLPTRLTLRRHAGLLASHRVAAANKTDGVPDLWDPARETGGSARSCEEMAGV